MSKEISIPDMVIDLDSAIATEQVVQVAAYAAAGIFLLVLLLSFQVFIMRIRFLSNRKRRYRLLKKWRPELTHMLLGGKSDMPVLPRRETCVFLEEWNRMFGAIRGEHLEPLIKLAHHLRIDLFARRMLKTRSMRNRLLAIMTLGHMREFAAWDELVELLQHPHPIISINAARALMWIDAKHAVDIIMPLILQRNDWPWSNVAHVLKQANPQLVCEKLSQLASIAPPDRQPGLLRYLETTRCLQLTKTITDVLRTTEDDRVSSVCLHIIADPDALPIIRKFVIHPRWHVRMHAATALGRFGEQDDIQILLKMAEDQNWWVRYRAAQAIVKIPSQTNESLCMLRDQHQDKYARDILTQVIAEVQQQ